MKILMFSNSPIKMDYTSGTGNWVTTLIEQLLTLHDLNISVAYHDNKVKRLTQNMSNGIEFYRIPTTSKGSKLKRTLFSWLNIDPYLFSCNNYRKIVLDSNPDIIQIFGLESPFIKLLKWKNDNVIIHIQGLLAPYIYKYYPRFSDYDLLKSMSWKDWLKGNIILWQRNASKRHIRLEKSIYGKILYVFGRTDWDRRCIRAMAPQAKYFYSQEIMRTQFYDVKWRPQHHAKKTLYTTIRDNWVKNVDMIFETAAILDKHNPEFQYEWRVAGVSNRDTTPKIMQKRGVKSPNIYLLGRLTSNEIVNELKYADLFVYPSAIENSCNAVQEAMLCGIPVLCTYAGGMSNLIENNSTGISISEGDPYSMAGAILEMFDDYNRSVKLGERARQVALNRHNPQHIVNCVMDAYTYILSRTRRNNPTSKSDGES